MSAAPEIREARSRAAAVEGGRQDAWWIEPLIVVLVVALPAIVRKFRDSFAIITILTDI